jgi:spermidine/putrescine transport system permease protein/putrescine transport system permease protein
MSVTTARPAPAVARPTAATARQRRRRRGSGMGRKPRAAVVVTVLFFVLLYLPILAVVVFSFNQKKSLAVFDGWSLRWYDAFLHDSALTHSLGTSVEVAAVAMAGSVVLGTALAFGLVRARSRLGGAANLIMLIPLVTPEIVTGVASLMLFKGVGLQPGLATLMIAETTFSISYVTVILRSRVAELNPEVEEAAMDLGATRAQAVRLVTLPLLWPAILSSAILIFTIVFDDFVLAFFTTGVSPQPLSVRIYSAIRFGVQPSINAVGTLMLLGSIVLIAISLVLPRLLGRGGSGLDLFESQDRS